MTDLTTDATSATAAKIALIEGITGAWYSLEEALAGLDEEVLTTSGGKLIVAS